MAVDLRSRAGAPEDETVRLARKDFARRRHLARLRRWRPWLIAASAVIVMTVASWLVFFSSQLSAERVVVEGATTVRPERVVRTARVPLGRPLARVDLEAAAQRVEQLATVRDATVSRSWPHVVRVRVAEREPLAVVDQGAGLRAVDIEGVLFHRYPQRPPELPVLKTAADTDAESLAEGARVVASLPASVAANLDFVEVASIDRISLVLRDRRRVEWGSAADSDQKAQVLVVLLDRPGTRYDVSVPSRPTVR